jgi:hypothetical protein
MQDHPYKHNYPGLQRSLEEWSGRTRFSPGDEAGDVCAPGMKLRLQDMLFPKKSDISPERFGTASEPWFFAGWVPGVDAKTNLASLIAASWNPLMDRLKALGSLRDLVQTATH